MIPKGGINQSLHTPTRYCNSACEFCDRVGVSAPGDVTVTELVDDAAQPPSRPAGRRRRRSHFSVRSQPVRDRCDSLCCRSCRGDNAPRSGRFLAKHFHAIRFRPNLFSDPPIKASVTDVTIAPCTGTTDADQIPCNFHQLAARRPNHRIARRARDHCHRDHPLPRTRLSRPHYDVASGNGTRSRLSTTSHGATNPPA